MIHGAVEAARILGEAPATDQLGPDLDHRRAPRAITSLLTLVGERLQDLRRANRRSRHDAEHPPAHDAAGWDPRTPDERVLALCAMRQRADVATREVQGAW